MMQRAVRREVTAAPTDGRGRHLMRNRFFAIAVMTRMRRRGGALALGLAGGIAGLALAGSALAAPHATPRAPQVPVATAQPRSHHVAVQLRQASDAHTAIVGGAAAPVGSFPWLAFVVDLQSKSSAYLCSGTVVSPNVILTAGHCVIDLGTGRPKPPSQYRVVTGNVNWADTAARQISAVVQIVAYPGYNPVTGYGDAALLLLSPSTTAPAIPLATPADSGLIQPGDSIAVTGWGQTSAGEQRLTTALRWGPVVTQSSAYCAQQDGAAGLIFDSNSELCAIDPTNFTVGGCHGDSGGPAIAEPTPTSVVEVGITSRGDAKCDTKVPTVFTRVDLVSGWVKHMIAAVVPSPTAPAPSAPTTPGGPQAGKYNGKSSQQAGHVSLRVTSGGVRRLHVVFNLQCPRGRRGPLSGTSTWSRSNPLALTVTDGVWGFSTTYTDPNRWHYSIKGSFRNPGTAAGTLTITTHNRECTTRRVSWSAAA